jgi:hypothetical protein
MTTGTIITPIWDYGWLAGDDVEFPPAASDRELLERYVSSPAFHTSFIPSDRDETGIHGPFIADRIVASDFVPLKESALEEYLAALLYSSEWDSPASAEQFAAVLGQLRKPFAQGMRCFLLRFDESRSDLHHDWGFALTVFREFLFLGRRPGVIARFVIGYD